VKRLRKEQCVVHGRAISFNKAASLQRVFGELEADRCAVLHAFRTAPASTVCETFWTSGNRPRRNLVAKIGDAQTLWGSSSLDLLVSNLSCE
jgi:hypothetical protein